ncbi:MAG: hypothetical protein OK474_06840 [Thaumarchaeota archaeon]|nr:hypothetical protein [Nitrososphaerota archaeon]
MVLGEVVEAGIAVRVEAVEAIAVEVREVEVGESQKAKARSGEAATKVNLRAKVMAVSFPEVDGPEGANLRERADAHVDRKLEESEKSDEVKDSLERASDPLSDVVCSLTAS